MQYVRLDYQNSRSTFAGLSNQMAVFTGRKEEAGCVENGLIGQFHATLSTIARRSMRFWLH